MESLGMVQLVDRYDNELGQMDKLEAHLEGSLHRAFSIFVLRKHESKTQTLLQKRASGKYHSGGLWSNTCCSHAKVDIPIDETAHLRLKEEMGISCPLQRIGSFYYRTELSNGMIEHEIDHVFIGTCNPPLILINEDEVEEHMWIDLKKLDQNLLKNPNLYTPWLPIALDYVKQKISNEEFEID